MSRQDKFIDTLNERVKFRIAPSKIHGVGVFAIRDIPKGTKLYANIMPQMYTIPYSSFNKLFPDVRELILERWPNVVNGSAFFYPDTPMQVYLNHSDEPNYDGVNDLALSDIKAGDELLEDYRKIPNYEEVYKWLK